MSDLETENGGLSTESDSLRSALEGAFENPTPDTSAPVETAEQASARMRDEKGRFAPKADAPPEDAQKPDATQQATETAQAATRKPPASWKKEWQQHWESLTPAHQDVILEREKDVDRGFQERATKYKPYEELDRLLEPRRDQFARMGISYAQGIEKLLAANDFLERDAAGAILQLAASYGVNLAALASNSPETAAPNRELYELRRELQELKNEREAEKSRILHQTIEQFKADPANVHFDAVKETMGQLLMSRQARDLMDAYEKAVWLNPETRAQLIAAQAPAASSAPAKADAVAKAKSAAVSVKGAPTGGPATGAPARSLREELETHYL